jgi:HD-GYP domain-containing protein (c-di-GMP phosphodiesterase class II)
MSTRPPSLMQSENVLQPLGRALVTAVYAAAQGLKLYPIENATVQKALDELHRIARRIVEREGALDLRLVGDFLFLNDARLRLDLSDYMAFSYLAGLMRKHRVGQIEAEVEITRDNWAPLLSLLLMEPTGSEAEVFAQFAERLASSSAEHVHAAEVKDEEELPEVEPDDRAKEAAKRTYFQSVQVAKDVLTDARLGRAMNVRRIKRAVQGIVDQVLNNETSLVGMTTLRDFDEYTFTHSVNVCIMSVVIGQRLALNKLQLYELGLGALFHDIGKMKLGQDLINKSGTLTDDEWNSMQQHPVDGLIALFSMRGMADLPFRAMLSAYEHHMKVDLTGYPKNRRPRTPRLFSRIVAVADGFDAATSKRSYRALPWPPDEVIREMRDNRSRGYDPVLVKALTNVTGIYPTGVVVVLDTYELAVVIARNPDPRRMHQPIVKIICNPMGIRLAEPETRDLAELSPDTGLPLRSIIKTIDPDRYGINIAEYFV